MTFHDSYAPSTNPKTNIAPWLSIRNMAAAVDYYRAAFGAVELYRLPNEDGTPAIVQFSVQGADFWIQEDLDSSPDVVSRSTIRMIVTVEDPDAMFARALAAGAAEAAPISEGHGWRTGRIIDPFGHHWEFAKRLSE